MSPTKVFLTDGRVGTVKDAYRASAEEDGVLMVSTANGNALFGPPVWRMCISEDVEIEWTEPPQPQPVVAGDPEKGFSLPFGVVDRRDAVDRKLRELDN